MAIHVASVALMHVNQVTGEVFRKDSSAINKFVSNKTNPTARPVEFSTEHRIVIDADIPNSADNPTIKEYLVAEDADGFELVYMDQYMIVTKQ